MRNLIDLTDQKFGRLIVLKREGLSKDNKPTWFCKCDCGNNIIVQGNNLRSGNTKSCGCLQKEQVGKMRIELNITHNMSKTRTYRIWLGMLNRCRNKNNSAYKNYGKRGITVCKRWFKFENFYADMGRCPKGFTIERIDNGGNYELNNCKWATRKEQTNNSRRNIMIQHQGYNLNITEWAKKTGINYSTLITRIKKGWSIEKALTKSLMINQWR